MNDNVPQLWIIGGGEVHASREKYLDFLKNYPYELRGTRYNWKSWLISGLSDKMTAIKPDFPNKQNADYDAWKLWFEKYINTYCQHDIPVHIIAHSLGGIFIVKYLSQHVFPATIKNLHLIAPVFDDEGLNGEVIGNFSLDISLLDRANTQATWLHIWHSKDDPIVPYSHVNKYKQYLTNAKIHTFENRGHFANQASFIELFTELYHCI